MRFVRLSDKIKDKRLAQPIVNNKGQILVAKNQKLTDKRINLLLNQGIRSVYISSEIKSSLTDVIPQEERKEEIKEFKTFADGILSRVNNSSMRNIKRKIQLHNDLNQKIDAIARNIINKVNINMKLSVVDIKSMSDYLYEHQVNVCILSVYLGRKLGLDQIKIKHLAKAALIYDYGNFLIEETFILEDRKLTNEEILKMQKHTQAAYEFFKNNTDFSVTEILPALEHHERIDGKGYPSGKKGDKIHLFSKIIAITDAYDSLTSDRPFRKAYPQSEAIELLMGSADRAYDFELTNIFVRNIVPYPNGTKVLLSDRKSGFVINQNIELPLRPKIIVTSDRFTGLIDLKHHMNITIKRVILD